MRQERIEGIRNHLIEIRENLLMDLRNKTAEAAGIADAGVPDPGDSSMNDYLTDFLHIMGDNRREQILKIDEALQRLQEGTYGICQNCGENIPIGRLELQPHTPYCVECKEDLERQEALRSGRPEMGKL